MRPWDVNDTKKKKGKKREKKMERKNIQFLISLSYTKDRPFAFARFVSIIQGVSECV